MPGQPTPAPPNCSDSDVLVKPFSNIYKITRELKKEQNSLFNCVNSILADAAFINEIKDLYPRVPLLANLRCGLWYTTKPDGTCYFKSTDGHNGNWSFSCTRLNLHVAELAAATGGCIIVDATRKGKRFPDALTKTIPIWATVVNRAIARVRAQQGLDANAPGEAQPKSSPKLKVTAMREPSLMDWLDETADSPEDSSAQHPNLNASLFGIPNMLQAHESPTSLFSKAHPQDHHDKQQSHTISPFGNADLQQQTLAFFSADGAASPSVLQAAEPLPGNPTPCSCGNEQGQCPQAVLRMQSGRTADTVPPRQQATTDNSSWRATLPNTQRPSTTHSPGGGSPGLPGGQGMLEGVLEGIVRALREAGVRSTPGGCTDMAADGTGPVLRSISLTAGSCNTGGGNTHPTLDRLTGHPSALHNGGEGAGNTAATADSHSSMSDAGSAGGSSTTLAGTALAGTITPAGSSKMVVASPAEALVGTPTSSTSHSNLPVACSPMDSAMVANANAVTAADVAGPMATPPTETAHGSATMTAADSNSSSSGSSFTSTAESGRGSVTATVTEAMGSRPNTAAAADALAAATAAPGAASSNTASATALAADLPSSKTASGTVAGADAPRHSTNAATTAADAASSNTAAAAAAGADAPSSSRLEAAGAASSNTADGAAADTDALSSRSSAAAPAGADDMPCSSSGAVPAWDTSLHLPPWISRNEAQQIERRLDGWVDALLQMGSDIAGLASRLRKPLRPLWLSQASLIWVDQVAQPADLDFTPLILVSSSQPQSYQRQAVAPGVTGQDVQWTHVYVPGAGDDEESWACGLTPQLLWQHSQDLVAAGPSGVLDAVKQLLKSPALPAPSAMPLAAGPSGVSAPSYRSVETDEHHPAPRGCVSAVGMADVRSTASGLHWVGSTGLAIGPHSAGEPPGVWHDVQAILNCGLVQHPALAAQAAATAAAAEPLASTSSYLWLPVLDAKHDRASLLSALGCALRFVSHHLQQGHRVLIHDTDGLDRCVCITVAVLLACFDGGDPAGQQPPRYCGGWDPAQQPPEPVTKHSVRQRLALVSASYPLARPTRGMLKQVFNFFEGLAHPRLPQGFDGS